jgi:hypothetical protein
MKGGGFMKEREFLQRKYLGFGCETIAEFVRKTHSILSCETWGAVLNRGDKISVRTLMVMCAELNCSAEEMNKLLVDRGEVVIAKWVKPGQFTLEEGRIVERIRKIVDPKKIKLLQDMIDNL